MAQKSSNVGGQNPEFILREFMAMNCLTSRECIEDQEMQWCENAIPIAPAALYPVPATLSPPVVDVPQEAANGTPTYTTTFNVKGTDYTFAVWSNSGNGYVINMTTFTSTVVGTGIWTSGQTSATQYSNQGLLIVDPTGYWDWNLTNTNTLTSQNNAATNATLAGNALQVAGGTSLKQVVSGTGTGATFRAVYQVVNVLVTAAGTGYAVGDSITLTDGSPTTPAQIIVATISGGGATGPITGITLATGGAYPGPPNSTLVATGPTGNAVSTTGSGTGVTFTCHIQAVSMNILTRGTGYTGLTEVTDETATTNIDTWSIASSGVIGGTSIATYAGRVWIGLSRTVYFTDINSYNSFGGVGGSFFISDSYLHDNVTALYAANNYLYIFGDSSIDALSNVTVSAGVTFFSRINVTASVGTSTPTSIFAYYRAIMFYHSSGFYLLSGATPEKISDKISQIIPTITASTGTGSRYPLVYGGQLLIQGELCACFNFCFVDPIAYVGNNRNLIAVFFRGRWWVASYYAPGGSSPPAMLSIDQNGAPTLYAWEGNNLFQLFGSTGNANWLIKTKLWDGGATTHEKQSINAAVGAVWATAGLPLEAVRVTIDDEFGSSPATLFQSPGLGYGLSVNQVNQGGGQYLGMTISGNTQLTQINMLALRGKTDRDMLQ